MGTDLCRNLKLFCSVTFLAYLFSDKTPWSCMVRIFIDERVTKLVAVIPLRIFLGINYFSLHGMIYLLNRGYFNGELACRVGMRSWPRGFE